MGLTLHSQDSIAAIATSFSAPISTDLVALYLFDEASIGRNYVDGGQAATIIGTPTQSSQFGAKFNATNYLETNLIMSALKPSAPEHTIIAVTSNDAANASVNMPIVSSFRNKDAAGVSSSMNGEGLAFVGSTLAGFHAINNNNGSYNNANILLGRSGFSAKNTLISASRYKYKDENRVNEYNSGTTNTGSMSAETTPTLNTKSLKVGAFTDDVGNLTGIQYNLEFYLVLIYKRKLSDTEMATLVSWITTKFLPARGITL